MVNRAEPIGNVFCKLTCIGNDATLALHSETDMAQTKIPDSLKAELPQNIWGKILAATPVVMAVVSTMLAGLASSEMTKAQYDRSFAAQLQSKAGDQWNYYQAKKLRSAQARNSLDVLAATARFGPDDREHASRTCR